MSTTGFLNAREEAVRQLDLNGQSGGFLKNSSPVLSPGLQVRTGLKGGVNGKPMPH